MGVAEGRAVESGARAPGEEWGEGGEGSNEMTLDEGEGL